jgi:hypothetical protein
MFNKGECTTCAGNKCSQMGYYANKYKGIDSTLRRFYLTKYLINKLKVTMVCLILSP